MDDTPETCTLVKITNFTPEAVEACKHDDIFDSSKSKQNVTVTFARNIETFIGVSIVQQQSCDWNLALITAESVLRTYINVNTLLHLVMLYYVDKHLHCQTRCRALRSIPNGIHGGNTKLFVGSRLPMNCPAKFKLRSATGSAMVHGEEVLLGEAPWMASSTTSQSRIVTNGAVGFGAITLR
jgi:hypothetical protein